MTEPQAYLTSCLAGVRQLEGCGHCGSAEEQSILTSSLLFLTNPPSFKSVSAQSCNVLKLQKSCFQAYASAFDNSLISLYI